jgi:hypothetical protein
MDYNQPNPVPIGHVIFDPLTGEQRSGSWGVQLVAVGAPGVYTFLLSEAMGGIPRTDDQVFDLHVDVSVKEIFTGYTFTPKPGAGFVLDFGAPMVNPISVRISKLNHQQ